LRGIATKVPAAVMTLLRTKRSRTRRAGDNARLMKHDDNNLKNERSLTYIRRGFNGSTRSGSIALGLVTPSAGVATQRDTQNSQPSLTVWMLPAWEPCFASARSRHARSRHRMASSGRRWAAEIKRAVDTDPRWGHPHYWDPRPRPQKAIDLARSTPPRGASAPEMSRTMALSCWAVDDSATLEPGASVRAPALCCWRRRGCWRRRRPSPCRPSSCTSRFRLWPSHRPPTPIWPEGHAPGAPVAPCRDRDTQPRQHRSKIPRILFLFPLA